MAEIVGPVVGVVDDEPAVRESLRFLLETSGYTVETFATGAELLASEFSRLACLILDHHMPNMTGLALAERLREQGQLLPIVLITGAPSPIIVARAAELGIERVLEKPPEVDDLLDFLSGVGS
jgi:FixJ family two-component response regulator